VVGGEDLDPALWGEEPTASFDPVPDARQRFDLALARAIHATRHPVLGICYGCQLLVVAAGGSLLQDLPAGEVRHGGGRYPHLPRHEVAVLPGSRLAALLGPGPVEVNSAHHQAPHRLEGGLVATARATDGVIEAVEVPGDPFRLGVMWHPELMPGSEEQERLFSALVEEAGRHRVGRR
jgi:putative glutamine amidotransferase